MKKQNYYNDLRACWLIAVFLLSACGSYTLEEETEESGSSKGYQMSLNVRSGGIDLEPYYPLTVFLFNENDELIERKEITDTEEIYSKTLGKGTYTLTAFSGLSEDTYTVPENPSINNLIQIQSQTPIKTPLLSGQSRVSLTDNTQFNLSLSYAVSALHFTLQAVPADATAVEMQISPNSSGMSFIGNYNNDNQS